MILFLISFPKERHCTLCVCVGGGGGGGGAVAQSAERATPEKEIVGSIPAVAARSLLVGSESV